jgi:mercuric ion transport protein
MNHPPEITSCNCHNNLEDKGTDKSFSKIRKTTRSLPSIFMSILIAFFPKCPLCWAIYMSMFGTIGLAKLPYMSWLLPVLLLFLGIHLFMLFKKSAQKGYLPFLVSLAGAMVILSGRSFFPLEKWLLITGMSLIIAGSLLNNFSNIRLPIIFYKRNNLNQSL